MQNSGKSSLPHPKNFKDLTKTKVSKKVQSVLQKCANQKRKKSP